MLERYRPATAVLASFVAVAGWGACGGEDEAGIPVVTYSAEIRGMVEANCTGCHFRGGSAPFPFETHADVVAAAPAMLDAMNSGRMPPWPADPSCRSYQNERLLAPEDVTTFRYWVEQGSPEGAPSEPITVISTSFEPTATATAVSPYTPDLGTEGDDYRCFLLNLDFANPTWVTGSTVEPATEAVHHVLVYALSGDQIAEAEALDAAEEGEGYTCFGGPLPGVGDSMGGNTGALPTQIAAWVPGNEPRMLPDGVGIPIAAGSRVVMQMHYSAAGGTPRPDQTALLLRTQDTPPNEELRTVPLAITDLDIPAGSDDVTVVRTFKNWSDRPATIRTLTGHMHLLGTSIRAEAVTNGDDEVCGLHIPDWDFDWQVSYDLLEDQPLVLAPGEGIELTCTYDNSPENQPVVNGEQQAPRDVQWGDGSLDEMCLLYAAVVEPYTEPAMQTTGACGSVSECYAASDGSLSALLACENISSDCVICGISAVQSCGLTQCLLPLASSRACIANCIVSVNAFGGSIDRCLQSECGEPYSSFLTCVDPEIQSGSCGPVLADSCGLSGNSGP